MGNRLQTNFKAPLSLVTYFLIYFIVKLLTCLYEPKNGLKTRFYFLILFDLTESGKE